MGTMDDPGGRGAVAAATREVVERFIALAKVGRRDEAMAFMSPQVVVRQSPALPFGGEYHGHDGYADLGRRFAEIFAERAGGPGAVRLLVGGDTAIAMGQVVGRLHGQTETVIADVLEKYVVRDGLIVEIVPFYFDQRFADMPGGGMAAAENENE